ncbi:hypothetical protein Pla163_06260 [Planctomycetes bacterium Pla163]|uniref:DUF1552 domain-containing protein n=1 Tax=Rohdeia mirabilis TaxID=2528008 RepID=A0A518CWC1_9BACT|nr:hypothetical protein Pla163_06260 [Planctomycetes bacterium Pla163]
MWSTTSRRAFLRGAGAAIALPFLPSFARASVLGAPARPPVRLGFFFMPNGVLPSAWTPKGVGAEYELSPTLEPLAALKARTLVLSGLRNAKARTGEGHYVKTASLLSGAPVRKTAGRDLEVGESVDQLAARLRGHLTPLPSLELSLEPVRNVVDMGFSTVYGAHISWSSPTRPVPREIDPRLVFERMFDASRLGRDPAHASVLDLVRSDARALRSRLSSADGEKVEEFLEGLRALELRVQRFTEASDERRRAVDAGARPADDLPDDYPTRARLMLELIAQAFATDTTRIASLMWGNAVSSRSFRFLDGVDSGFHPVSHHENDPDKQRQYALINRWHVAELAWLAERLASMPEGEEGGSVLDSCALFFGSGLRDGNKHDPNDLPIAVVGDAGGRLATGQHLASKKHTPLCHVYVDLLRAFGAPVDRFGDAVGGLEGASVGV